VSSVEKIAMGIVGVALVTTLILPNRQTPRVLAGIESLFTGGIRAAMGR
jgi:hypothetical protein